MREDPSHSEAAYNLVWNLLSTGYFEEALAIAERFVELDPLSARAHSQLAQALISNGRLSEAITSFEIGDQLGMPFDSYFLGIAYLLEEQDEIAIDHLESFLRKQGQPDEWVRGLVVGARDPESGQAHLDRVILRYEDEAAGSRGEEFYFAFKFLDRFFEIIFEIGLTGVEWSPAEGLVFTATILRQSGFTADPRYLEWAEADGLFELWDERGAPDHCEKLDGQWVCE